MPRNATKISAAFILPDEADVRAILLALDDIKAGGAYIHASINRPEMFSPWNTFWVLVDGEEAQVTLDAVMALLPTFGLTYTQV